MTLKISRDTAKDINKIVFYCIMADEVKNSANKEQFVICFRWIDDLVEVHEDYIGLYYVDNIRKKTS